VSNSFSGWTLAEVESFNRRHAKPSPVKIVDAAPPEKRESELHEKIMAACRVRGWIYFHGSMATRTRRTIGEPDFIVLADGGRVFFVEVKTAKGKLSPEQFSMQHHAAKLGHTVHVVRSMGDFYKVIETGIR